MMVAQKSQMKIQCSGCNNEQDYNLRNPAKIPKRPKTQCANPDCEKWIYVNRDQLVKKFGQKSMTKNDQKEDLKKPLKPRNKPKKLEESKIKTQINLTKNIDQRPKNHDQINSYQNKTDTNINFVKLLGEEVKRFN
ncbi:hypothetical protein LCGC14_1377190, partial [marine sediment metagenome]